MKQIWKTYGKQTIRGLILMGLLAICFLYFYKVKQNQGYIAIDNSFYSELEDLMGKNKKMSQENSLPQYKRP